MKKQIEVLKFPDDFAKRPHPMLSSIGGASPLYGGLIFYTQYYYEGPDDRWTSVVIGNHCCEVYDEEYTQGDAIRCSFDEIQDVLDEFQIPK